MDLQRRQLTQISFLYYEKNMTQQEISKITGLSRIKVSGLLQKAKDTGIVKITLDYSCWVIYEKRNTSNKDS